MTISSVTRNAMVASFTDMRSTLEGLQRQLSTGEKSDTFGGLGTARSQSVSFHTRISSLEAYTDATKQVNLRVKLLDTAMNRLDTVPTDVRKAIDPNSYTVRLDGKTDAQKSSAIALDEVVGLLNSQSDGRYLMSGKSTDTKPVMSVDEILNGTGTKAGLRQVIAERLTADLGTGTGSDKLGRLTIAGGGTTTIGRETALPDEFGYKIAGITATSSTSAITTGTTTVTAGGTDYTDTASATFGDNVAEGDAVTLALVNPDGTQTSITLTATKTSPAATGSFTIGANGDETGSNFAAALQSAVVTKTKSEFQSASAMRASETFFNTYGDGHAARVDTAATGGDLATATALTYDTNDTTVQWYQGYNAAIDSSDSSTLPRNDITARIDSSVTLGYGVRANEAGYAKMMQALGVMSVETFDGSVSTDEGRYSAMAERVRDTLAFDKGSQGPSDIHSEIAVVGKVATDTATQHDADKNTIQELLDGVEGVNKEDIAAQIMTLQNRMQASYQTASILWGLSLVNYM
jgi:hypothetical protein